MESIAHHWGKQGIKKAEIYVAKKMLNDKEPIEKIAKYTRLHKKEIEKLIINLNKN